MKQSLKKTIINKKIIFYLLFVLNITCKSQELELKSIDLIVNYPLVVIKDSTNTIYNLNDTITITEFKNYRIYKLKPKRELLTNERIKNSSSYFSYHKDSLRGNFFSTTSSINKPKLLNVDSLLTLDAFLKLDWDITSDYKINTVVKTNSETIEQYYFNYKSDNMMDSVFFYFKKKADIFYSFSPNLDKSRGQKLYKIRLLYNSKFVKQYNQYVPKREFNFEIQESNKLLDSFILEIIKKYCIVK